MIDRLFWAAKVGIDENGDLIARFPVIKGRIIKGHLHGYTKIFKGETAGEDFLKAMRKHHALASGEAEAKQLIDQVGKPQVDVLSILKRRV